MLRAKLPLPFSPLAPQRSQRLPPPLLPCVFRSLRRLSDPHSSGRIIACAHCTHTASLCQRSFHWPGGCSLILRLEQPPGLLHSLTLPFLCSCSLTQSLCSLMLRSSTPSFTSFTQPRYFMANASLCSSGVCRQ